MKYEFLGYRWSTESDTPYGEFGDIQSIRGCINEALTEYEKDDAYFVDILGEKHRCCYLYRFYRVVFIDEREKGILKTQFENNFSYATGEDTSSYIHGISDVFESIFEDAWEVFEDSMKDCHVLTHDTVPITYNLKKRKFIK